MSDTNDEINSALGEYGARIENGFIVKGANSTAVRVKIVKNRIRIEAGGRLLMSGSVRDARYVLSRFVEYFWFWKKL